MIEYKKSLIIAEELCDRASMANSHGQIAQLCLEISIYADAFKHFLFAFKTFVDLKSPNVRIAVNDLKSLRAKWGTEKFRCRLARENRPSRAGGVEIIGA